jgi:hypothetical protein
LPVPFVHWSAYSRPTGFSNMSTTGKAKGFGCISVVLLAIA